MPIYPFECGHCQQEVEDVLTISEYEVTSSWECPACDGEMTKADRIICAASVTRASFVDGTKRPGFAENREIMKLRKAGYDMKHEDRGDIKKTIKAIERSGK